MSTKTDQRAAAACLAIALASASLMLSGCASEQRLDGPTYPIQTQGRTLDVQVRRDVTEITMINTTSSPIPPGRMWINAWFSREFPGLGVGDRLTLDLYDFKDRYNVAFNGGGFFATQRPDRVMQAQVHANGSAESPGELIGLVVVRGDEE